MSRPTRNNNGGGKSRNFPSVAEEASSEAALPYSIADVDEDEDDYDEDAYGTTSRNRAKKSSNTTTETSQQRGASHVTETSVPNFLLKLWKLVEDKNYDYCISWDPSGTSFHVWEPYTFSKDILPLFFKHSNLNSFIRQLNMYGFRKVTNLEQGALKRQTTTADSDAMEFHHQYFIRNKPELLPFIKRKNANLKTSSGELVEVRDAGFRSLNQAMEEIRQLREKQQSMDARFGLVRRENQALWREIASLRQTHMKQQQVVNKMIQFLMAFVKPADGGSVGKRKIFAIGPGEGGSAEIPSKRQRGDPVYSEALEQEFQAGSSGSAAPVVNSDDSDSFAHLLTSIGGERIVEVQQPIISTISGTSVTAGDILTNNTSDYQPAPAISSLHEYMNASGRAIGTELGQPVEASAPIIDDSPPATEGDIYQQQQLPVSISSHQQQQQQQVGPGPYPVWTNADVGGGGDTAAGDTDPTLKAPENFPMEWTTPDFNEYVDGVQADLDTLNDFLLSEGLELDTDALNELLQSPENIMMESAENTSPAGHGDIMGNELQVYKPPEFLIDFDTSENDNNTTTAAAVAPACSSHQQNTIAGAENGNSGSRSTLAASFVEPALPSSPFICGGINGDGDNVFSSTSIAQSPLQTPVMSPAIVPTHQSKTSRVPRPGQETPEAQQRDVINYDGGRPSSAAADELLRSALFKSKSGKRR